MSNMQHASMALNGTHFEVLQNMSWLPAGAGGVMPTSWADMVLHQWDFDIPLPARRLTRQELRAYSRDPETPPMHAYIAIMAWGGQSPRSKKYRADVAAQEAVIIENVQKVRDGLSRAEAYELWIDAVWGLGPSFFTKILCFLCPDENMAIMDQWAVKALNLLYGREVIRLSNVHADGSGGAPSGSNRGDDYERYCRYLEKLQVELGEASISAAEERIFYGSPFWRDYVKTHWQAASNAHRRGA